MSRTDGQFGAKPPVFESPSKSLVLIYRPTAIVTSLKAESKSVDDKTDEDEDNNNENSKRPSNAGSFSALETTMEWCEKQSECCPTQLLLLKRIIDLAAKN
ncbi:hypothetical protein TNCV_2665231 [Trichonephila clavipes]|nr:hypothetical protein TNCV_2665231 [Trichonephila clavipes]